VQLFIWFTTSALIAVGIAAFTRQRGWGMALPVLTAGVIVGFLPVGPNAPPEPEIILAAILAPLVFGEALGSSFLDLRKVRKPVLTLAIGLVLATTLIVGGVLSLMVTAPLALAFALGAVLAPTDAVAVSAVARRASLDRRLVSILEGESLVNDGTGLTLLRVAVIMLLAGSVTLGQVAGTLALSVIGGVAVGVAGGWIVTVISRRTTDVVASNGLIVIAPFVLYLGAERIQGSGILAVVVAALWIAHAQSSDIGHAARLQGRQIWRQLTFLLQAMAFFLVGLELTDTLQKIKPGEYGAVVFFAALVVVVLIVIRFAFVFAMVGVMRVRGTSERSGALARGAAVVAWAGARGPVSGLAAFLIPVELTDGTPVPHREAFLAVTFLVIVTTLLLSQTLGPVARLLGTTTGDDAELTYRVHSALVHAALERLDQTAEQADVQGRPLPKEAVMRVRDDFELELDRIVSSAPETTDADGQARAIKALYLILLRAEEEELVRIRDEEGLPDPVFRDMLNRIDIRREALRSSR
jgi:CPA1 family monovalent cation:H+ antiporter